MSGDESPRYAVYFVPASDTALGAMGCALLGYDSDSGADVPFADTCGLAEAAWSAATSEPRRYGFHATLKAPFRLKAGVTEAEFVADAQRVASHQSAIGPVPLLVKSLTRFVAMVPATSSPDIDRLETDVVGELDWVRAPLTAKDRERRLSAGLTERQRAYLEAYGYPYVGAEFRFHLTLAGPLPPASRDTVRQRLAALFENLDRTCIVDAFAVLRQDNAESRFRVIARCPLGRE
jgi:Protein of unknown function (DUF1045)